MENYFDELGRSVDQMLVDLGMTDQEYKKHMELAKKLLAKKWTKEEAFAELVRARQITKKGNVPKHYRELRKRDRE